MMERERIEEFAFQCCSEHKPSKLGYLQWHDDAELRTKAGQKQKQCPNCSLWFWDDEY